MGKDRIQYICNNCGANYAVWSGKCESCGNWNTLEISNNINLQSSSISNRKLKTVLVDQEVDTSKNRFKAGNKQIDGIFGGGIVLGSVALLSGEPGIGKSTLLMQIASMVSKENKVLYVSGEESVNQIISRANRLKVNSDNLKIANSNSTDEIVNELNQKAFNLVIVDSIQTISLDAINSSAGNVAQITNSANAIIRSAKNTNTAVIIVGHITKDGTVAGPKILEHLVDVVLYLEGDKYSGFKSLRASKNRFGSVNDVVIFEMMDLGLKVVDNPSKSLLDERVLADGSVVHASMQGSRAMLVEIQALVNKTSYGYPKRTASGFDLNRLNLIIAILEKRTKLNLANDDIYVNVVGGIKLSEPASDLAIAMAIASAKAGKKMKTDLVVFGELGLSGEIRHVPFVEKRNDEAIKLGFKGTIGPSTKNKINNYYQMNDLRTTLNKYLS